MYRNGVNLYILTRNLANISKHFVEFGFNLRVKIGFDLINLGKFGKRPTTIVSKLLTPGIQ